MNPYELCKHSLRSLSVVMSVGLVLSLLAGCGATNQSPNNSPASSPSPTIVSASISPTPDATNTLMPPEPSPVLNMGMFDCLSQKVEGFFYISCWRGMVNGELTSVAAGGDKVPGSYSDLPEHGVVLVSKGEDLPSMFSHMEVYRTPDQLGWVHIAAVNGTQLSIAPSQPNSQVTWIFDVAARQFISVAGTPVPTTPVPVP
jgi:hypothetical protein